MCLVQGTPVWVKLDSLELLVTFMGLELLEQIPALLVCDSGVCADKLAWLCCVSEIYCVS